MAADSHERAFQKVADQIIQPVLIGPAIGVRKGHHFAIAAKNARVTRHRESLMGLADVSEVLVEGGHLRRDVCGAVIDHDDLVSGIIEPNQ